MNDTFTPPAAPPPPASPPPRPMLRRSGSDRMLGGVCGGLAEQTGIDVILFRVGFVVLTVAGGAGLLLYIALWLLLPDAYGEPGSLQRWLAQRPSTTGRNVILAVAALFVAAVLLDGIGADAGVIAILAVAAMAYLWVRDRDRPVAQASVPPDDTTTAVTPEPAPYPHAFTVPPPAGQAEPVTAAERRPRSPLGRMTVSTLLLTLGVLVLLDRQTGFDLSTSGYLAVALGIVGAGLLVGTFWGRSRGLILLGIPLVILLAGASAFNVSLRSGIGDRYWQPGSAASVESSYEWGIGQVQLDLSDVDFEDADVAASVDAGIGYVRILVPADVDVRLTAEVGGGALTAFDVSTDASSGLRRTVTDTGADGPGGGQLDLAVDLGLGLVEVIRVS